MKRDDISRIIPNVTDEQISALLDINSSDIGKVKKERDDYKTQLDTVESKLRAFDGVDPAGLQTQIKNLTAELESTKAAHAKELDNIQFKSDLEEKVKSFNPKNPKLVMAMLDVDKLRDSKNRDADISAAVEAVKKENDYLFNSDKATPRVVVGTDTRQVEGTDKKAQANEAFRALLGKEN